VPVAVIAPEEALMVAGPLTILHEPPAGVAEAVELAAALTQAVALEKLTALKVIKGFTVIGCVVLLAQVVEASV